MAYYSIEPWGPERADLNTGIVASTIANCHRDAQRAKPFTPQDFMPKYERKEIAPASPKMVRNHFLAMFGDRIKRKAANGENRTDD